MIKLELIEKKDLKKIVEWNINKSADFLLQWAGAIYTYPLTIEQVENYYFNEVNKPNSNIFIYMIKVMEKDEIIGSIELRKVDKENRIGKACRFLIGDENYRGQGIGTEVLKQLINIGFEQFGYEKIIMNVFDFNSSAIKCYEKVGFKKEKFIEKASKASTGYWNLYEMVINKNNKA